MKGGKRWLKWIIGLILFLGLSSLMDPLGNDLPFLFVAHLGIGWWWHAAGVIPPLLSQWSAALLPLACLALSVPLAHRFMVWLAESRQGAWRWSQTLGVLALLLLGSAAAIAMSGITHQLAWLMSSQAVESTGAGGSFSKVSDGTRAWTEAVIEFESTKGRYPESLAEVAEAFPKMRGRQTIEPAASRMPEPFLYFKPKSEETVDWDTVLIVSPARPTTGLVFVGNAWGSVSAHPAEKVQALMERKEEP